MGREARRETLPLNEILAGLTPRQRFFFRHPWLAVRVQCSAHGRLFRLITRNARTAICRKCRRSWRAHVSQLGKDRGPCKFS